MGSLIDTSILIEVEKGRLNLEDYIYKDPGDEYFVSVITVSELLHGVHRAKPDAVRKRRSAIIEQFLADFPVIDIDLATARSHSRLWADLERSGTMIGAHDLWLAATCLVHGFKMITTNLREFRRVPGLEAVSWGKLSS